MPFSINNSIHHLVHTQFTSLFYYILYIQNARKTLGYKSNQGFNFEIVFTQKQYNAWLNKQANDSHFSLKNERQTKKRPSIWWITWNKRIPLSTFELLLHTVKVFLYHYYLLKNTDQSCMLMVHRFIWICTNQNINMFEIALLYWKIERKRSTIIIRHLAFFF